MQGHPFHGLPRANQRHIHMEQVFASSILRAKGGVSTVGPFFAFQRPCLMCPR